MRCSFCVLYRRESAKRSEPNAHDRRNANHESRNERRISNTAFVADFGTTSDPNPSNDQASTIVRVAGPR
jgi:hypothetical protein